jgi:hypothetical protein
MTQASRFGSNTSTIVSGYINRSHLVALRATKITASDPPSTRWPGER